MIDQMNLGKKLLLSIYYHSTLPLRKIATQRRCAVGLQPIPILFYHRIADDAATNWTLPNALFQRQIRWLQKHFELISLDELQRRLKMRYNPTPSVSLTFDDGYAENCYQAIPFLIKEKIPCTYFVSTDHLFTGKPFAHDVACGAPAPPNTIEEIRAMADGGVEIAAHTHTHADLGKISDSAELHREMIQSTQQLAAAIERPVRYFAFPYGQHRNLSNAAFQMAKQAGFSAVCSAYGGFNFPGDDPFHLQRFAVDNDMLRLKNWVTIDPRKFKKTKRFEYQIAIDDKPLASISNCQEDRFDQLTS